MKAVLAATGSRGDVQPMLALALALRAAGHAPVLCAASNFEPWVRQHDVAFVSAGDDMEALLQTQTHNLGANPVRLALALRAMAASQMPHGFAGVGAASEGADVVLSAGLFAAASVAEARGLPYLTVCYSPTLVPSADYPPLMSPWHDLPRVANHALWALQELAGDAIFLGAINKGRATLGLAPLRSLRRHLFEDHPALLAADPEVAPAGTDWARALSYAGFWYYDDPRPLAPEIEAFLAAGEPPVYIGFGSMVSADAARVTRALLEATARTGHRMLLSAGWAGIGAGELPARCMLVGATPHARLFPRMAAVVHHGGAGTTANALRAGVPQVVVPHLLDQYYWAHRLRVLGLAPPPVPIARLTAARLADAIVAAIDTGATARRRMAARQCRAHGLADAVQLIEAHVARARVNATARRSAR